MRLVKLFSFNLVCPKIILREYFFDEILLDAKKRITALCTLMLINQALIVIECLIPTRLYGFRASFARIWPPPLELVNTA